MSNRNYAYNLILFLISPLMSLLVSCRNVFKEKYNVYFIGAFFSLFGAFLPPLSDSYRYRRLYYDTHSFSLSLDNLWVTQKDFLYPFLSYIFNGIGIPFEYFRLLLFLICYMSYCWMFLDVIKHNPAFSNRHLYILAVLSLFFSIRLFTLADGIRFGVASTLIIVAIYLWSKKDYIKSSAIIVISATLHFSMLAMVPIIVLASAMTRLNLSSRQKLVILLVLLAAAKTSIGSLLMYLFPTNELVAGNVDFYIEGQWGTKAIMTSASFGGLMFTFVRILPVFPLAYIALRQQNKSSFLSEVSFLLLGLLCISISSLTLLLRFSNVTIAVLFIYLLTTTDGRHIRTAIKQMRIALVSFLIMFACYAYTHRISLTNYYMHYSTVLFPANLIFDEHTYTEQWIHSHLNHDGGYK